MYVVVLSVSYAWSPVFLLACLPRVSWRDNEGGVRFEKCIGYCDRFYFWRFRLRHVRHAPVGDGNTETDETE